MVKKKPTKKQVKLAKEYVKNGGNGTQAALVAYDTKKPKRAATIAARELKKPEVQEILRDELKRQNITLPRALAPIAKGLVATKKDVDGTVVDDLDTQLKSSDRALKLLFPDQKDNSVNVNLKIDPKHFGGEFVREAEVVDDK